MNRPPARIGDPLSAVDTPALIIDLDVFEQNLRKVQLYADRHGLRLRPHTKTHKSPEVARQQLALFVEHADRPLAAPQHD